MVGRAVPLPVHPIAMERQTQRKNVTYSMWGILTGMTMMFAVSLYRYRQSLARREKIRWLNEHHMIDRLRTRLGL